MSKISNIVGDSHWSSTCAEKYPKHQEFVFECPEVEKKLTALEQIQKEHEKTLDYNQPEYKYKKPEVIARTSADASKMVSHPNHYSVKDKTYEPYKVLAAWECNFNIGSAIKYLARYQKKWNPIEDLEKAKQYIDFEIERLKEQRNEENKQ